MAFKVGPVKIDASNPLNPVSVETGSGRSFDPFSLSNPLVGFEFTKDVLGLNKIETPSVGPSGRLPKLKPVAPPRRRAGRSADPFDFFGTLFTQPATAELNSMTLLNQTV